MRPLRPATALLCLCVWLCLAGVAVVPALAADDDLDAALDRVIRTRGSSPWNHRRHW